MSQQVLRSAWIGIIAVLASAAGCETPGGGDRSTAPGALPQAGSVEAAVLPKINASTYLAHATLLERQGEFNRAAEQYRRVLELTPESLIARNRLGITLNKLGRHAEATRLFHEAIDTHGPTAYLYNNLGFSLLLENRLEEADAALREALTLEPEFARARMNHGMVLARQRRWSDAFEQFAAASTSADAHYNVALLQSEARCYAEAARSLEQALAANPDFEAARQELREVGRRVAAAENPNQPAPEPAVSQPGTSTPQFALSADPGAPDSNLSQAIVHSPVTNHAPATPTPHAVERSASRARPDFGLEDTQVVSAKDLVLASASTPAAPQHPATEARTPIAPSEPTVPAEPTPSTPQTDVPASETPAQPAPAQRSGNRQAKRQRSAAGAQPAVPSKPSDNESQAPERNTPATTLPQSPSIAPAAESRKATPTTPVDEKTPAHVQVVEARDIVNSPER